MARQQTDHLFKLVKSLTKAEKRNFKLYVNRIGSSEHAKFLALFDSIDKQIAYNEDEILKKNPSIKPTQLSNLKANLSKNLLTSLRLMAQQTDIDLMLRLQLDNAKILYNKALYQQSLITLNKAKQQAKKANRSVLHFEMIEFEKLIESQYITRSIESRADELTAESDKLNVKISLSAELSNLAIRLYGFYIKNGHIRSEEDQIKLTDFFHRYLPAFELENLDFYEKLYLYQSHVWYYLILQDFLMVYRYSFKWVELFQDDPVLIQNQPDLYIKGYNNMLDGLYFSQDYSRFEKSLNQLNEIRLNKTVVNSKNIELLVYQNYFTHSINWFFMEGKFSEGTKIVPEIDDFLENNRIYLDKHIVLVFYYKIACLYFGSGDNKNTVKYLNKVINFKDVGLRSDIQCFARILNLIAHFEMENYDLIEYLVKTTYRFLAKMKDLHRTQKEVLFFLRRLPNIHPGELNSAFKQLLKELKRLRSDPYEKRPFLYLDIISWLESKIYEVPVQDVIRQKRLTGSFEK